VSKQIKRITGTALVEGYIPTYCQIAKPPFTSVDIAVNYAYYRAKKQNAIIRVRQDDRGYWLVEPAQESLPVRNDFYDIYKDGSIYSRG